ncbi:MAG: WD40 repeat domain-containing serine/threonine-protein kinase [Bacteroidia bacterium]|nr:WD40 repeat domain-containing serine/threonine-protein kinase [Bacteroidia bacterium]
MKSIKTLQVLSSQIQEIFNIPIRSIEIKPKPFASGGFGELYFCQSLNGNIQTPIPQVVKIFHEDSNAQKSFQTIQKLQEGLIRFQQHKNVSAIPALYALPQLSFAGILEGEKVYGYLANRLNRNEYAEFDRIIEDPKVTQEYYQISLGQKIKYALDLVEGFQVLRELNFIHADINAENVFIGIKQPNSVIIDYDSGAVTLSAQDSPSTWGKPNEWIAPEIAKQLSEQKIIQTVKVNLLSDIWSVAVGIHYFIFLKHPFFYLNDLSERTMKHYFTYHRWPKCDTNATYFNKSILPFYEKYLILLEKAIPQEIFKRFDATFNEGFYNPAMRTSYTTWINTLKPYSQIEKFTELSIPKEPEIDLKPLPRKKPVVRAAAPHQVIASPVAPPTKRFRNQPTQGYPQGKSPTQPYRQVRQSQVYYTPVQQRVLNWNARKFLIRIAILFFTLFVSFIVAINWRVKRISDSPKLKYDLSNPSEFVETQTQNTIIKTFVGHTGPINSVQVNKQGTKLVTASADKSIRTWDISTGNPLNIIYTMGINPRIAIFSPDGNRIAAPYIQKQIGIWDAHTIKEIAMIPTSHNQILSLAYSPEGTLLASADNEGIVCIWDLRTQKKVHEWQVPTKYEVNCIHFHPTQSLLAIGSSDKNVYVWAYNEKNKVKVLRGSILPISCLYFSPDGKRLLAGSWDKTLRIWDVEHDFEEIRVLWRSHNSEILCAAYSPDSKYILSGSKDKTIRLRDAITGKIIAIFNEDKEIIYSLTFSPDGRYAYTGGEDHVVKMWKIF